MVRGTFYRLHINSSNTGSPKKAGPGFYIYIYIIWDHRDACVTGVLLCSKVQI